MSKLKPEVEWLTSPTMLDQYGVVCLAGKWAAVKSLDVFAEEDYEVITEWVDDRKAAIGFLKLIVDKE